MLDRNPDEPLRAGTGIKGLNEILGGGFPRGEMNVVYGDAGVGKTTMGRQFLLDGLAKGEKVLFITLSQTEAALKRTAAAHGWSLDGVEIRNERMMDGAENSSEQTLFHTAEVELTEMMSALLKEIEHFRPDRLVFDSIAQIRHLADTQVRFQRQVLLLRALLSRMSTTSLILDSAKCMNEVVGDLADGVVALDRNVPDYDDVRRRLHVSKMRSMDFHGGNHNFRIQSGGIQVFPRLEADTGGRPPPGEAVGSGIEGLDKLLGGGMSFGTACVVVGPTGTGKTSRSTPMPRRNAATAPRSSASTSARRRSSTAPKSLGMELGPLIDDGRVTFRSVNTSGLSPGEFSQLVREAVERDKAKVVMIDTLTGYSHAMPQEQALVTQMHDLLAFLSERGVLSLVVVGQHGLLGENVQSPVDVSDMADTVIVLWHFKAAGSVHRVISVLKKRDGPHEATIRALRFAPGRIEVSEPVENFSGVLSGEPELQTQNKGLPE
ncbi:Circadian clock protein kinase KaiC [Jannaschia seosinensis]|uniref:Circadian clock protein kinase KaiC n=1 Tax=Jannaschia seosinensis TaxID=313367 RepID=A0A0M7B8B0_9RHOB|nr:ATPase domain-containing protein [Jannaschia seosinensis]CUH26545.1 Circadian clock protein kinase KaiC [Jannaschia seosinensis]